MKMMRILMTEINLMSVLFVLAAEVAWQGLKSERYKDERRIKF